MALDLIIFDDRIMLSILGVGQPIPMVHGFPLRIWFPDSYCVKQPQWITNIEEVSASEKGYWMKLGWDEVAQVKATSVNDNIAVDHV